MWTTFNKKIIFVTTFLCIATLAMATSVVNLTTEYMQHPLGIDVRHPRFAWQMQSDRYGAAQSAYRLMVAASLSQLDKGEYVYDTGKRFSATSVGIEYQGEALKPSTRYYWKVFVWDEKGTQTSSVAEWFETGITDYDWHGASWIGSPREGLSKYRSAFILDYDFQIAKKTGSAVFLFGAKSNTNFVSIAIDLRDKAQQLIVAHQQGNNFIKDACEDISAIVSKADMRRKHHVTVSVKGEAGYTMNISIDGKAIKCSADTKNPYRFNARTALPEETNANARLYNIGICQPKGENATFSNICITDPAWKSVLYRSDAERSIVGDGVPVLWQPGSDVSAPLLRRTLSIGKAVKSARLYVTARGIYQFYINGTTVGDGYYNPGWTDYRYRIMYNTYDVTSLLRQGNNALGIILGEGWYSGSMGWTGSPWGDQYGIRHSAIALIKLEYEDGTNGYITTDGTWKCYDQGPITANSLYNGEDYDARREVKNWNTASFDDSQWGLVEKVQAPASTTLLQAYVGNMIQHNVTLHPLSVKKVGNVYIYDFGQNMVGVPRLTDMKGTPGQQITLHYAEMLYPDVIPTDPVPPLTIDIYKERKGQMYLDNYRSALSTDHYIFSGDISGETYQPLFTSHGFRYMSIEGLDAPLALSQVQGIVLESIGQQKSSFETSNKEVNRLFENIVWGQRGNFLSVPTDCPQRDERLGWTGDAQIFARAATYNMNTDPFYTRWMCTVRDDQARNGDLGGYYPSLGVPPAGAIMDHAEARAGGWSDFGIIIPWQMYQQYGDEGILRTQYESMSRYMEYLERTAKDYIFPAGGFGDWVAPVSTHTSLINTAYWAYDAQIMQKVAYMLGKFDDATRYTRVFDRIKTSFGKTFIGEDGITHSPEGTKIDTQCSYILPLQFNLLSDSTKSKAVDRLAALVKDNGYRLSTGFLGTPYLCLVLSDNGHSDLAYKLFLQTEYPSWLFPVLQGATTIWERWNSYTVKNGFGPVSMNSFNHYSYGAIEEWMMSHCLGIQRDEQQPAYKHILLQPEVGEELDFARGGFESIYGTIHSEWHKTASGYTYSVTIPANTTATLSLPVAINKARVTKGKEGISAASFIGGKSVFQLKSGLYNMNIEK